MSLTENGNGMVMPVGPMYGNGSYGGLGDGLFWIIVLFLFAFMGNGFGGFGAGAAGPLMMNNANNDVQRGFDQQAVMGGIGGISAGINSLAQGQCAGFAGVTAAVNGGFSAAEIAANGRQIANMQQQFNSQTAIDGRLDSLAMTQQQCCCENRAAVADLKYTVANEGAVTRANTDAKVQAVMDKLCQLEMDGVKQNYENRIAGMQQNYQTQITGLQDQISALRNELGNARTDASQNAQTAAILRDNAAQTVALEQYLNPTPIPSYQVQNPNCCSMGWNSCGSFA